MIHESHESSRIDELLSPFVKIRVIREQIPFLSAAAAPLRSLRLYLICFKDHLVV
jgi:hypothetical protein